ncbi:transposase, partial [Paenibacillus eucommiae]
MDNNKKISVICQCLNVLNVEQYRSVLFDHRAKKLYTGNTIQLHLLGQLMNLGTYGEITQLLDAHDELKTILNLESISSSQLSRKTLSLCTSSLQALFVELVGQIMQLSQQGSGISPTIGRLSIIDASNISLPGLLGSWAKCGSRKCGVTLHMRYLVVNPSVGFPDKVIFTTSHVRESKVVMELIQADDVTYVMDRGYEKYLHFKEWLQDSIRFVVRVKERAR